MINIAEMLEKIEHEMKVYIVKLPCKKASMNFYLSAEDIGQHASIVVQIHSQHFALKKKIQKVKLTSKEEK